VAESCGVVARVRAVASRDDDLVRWCWHSVVRGGAAGCRGGGLELWQC
jgi:hypothetical protein